MKNQQHCFWNVVGGGGGLGESLFTKQQSHLLTNNDIKQLIMIHYKKSRMAD